MRKNLLVLLFLVTTIPLQAQLTGDLKKLDSTLNLLNQTDRFNGTILVAEKGKVLYKKAFGISDPLNGQMLSTRSSFNLASITKQFICAGLLILEKQGALNVNDTCTKFLPQFPYPGITLRQLMTHTSGLPEYIDLVERYRMPLDTLNNEILLDYLTMYKPALDFEPGTKWAYSNTGYLILASIIEKVSREPLEIFLKKEIFEPLQMRDSYVYDLTMKTIPANHVIGFKESGNKRELNDLTVYDGVAGDGNMYASVEDLLKWEQSLQTEKILPLSKWMEVFTPVQLKDGSRYPYGYGWFIKSDTNKIYYHTGGWTAFTNIIYRDLSVKRTLILLSNGSNGKALQLARSFMEGSEMKVTPTFLIQQVKLIDGTGTASRTADVRVEGNRIAAVGNLKPFPGEKVIKGEGKILSPGFIDTHSHLGGYLTNNPEALAALNQGVTTIISGQDGGSDPVDSIKARMQKKPAAINLATYTGQTSLRELVMGENDLSRTCTDTELAKMKELLQQELAKGSLGLSTGLEYEGAFYSNRNEVIELAKVAALAKKRYISHIRSEDIGLADALTEIIQIGKEAQLPVQISHFKIALKDDWGKAAEWIGILQKAREEGIDITADVYPYDFWNSTLRVLFPKKDFNQLSGAQFAVDHLFDPEGSVMVRFAPDTTYKGKTVAAIARLRKETPAQTLLYLVDAAVQYEKQHPGAGSVETIMGKSMSEADMIPLLSWAHSNICSDGANGGHPRGYGSFARVLHRYVKEQQIMSWETAIYKMTGLAAQHTGIRNRGIIAKGYFADLVLLDPDTIKDNASITDPKALSDGILYVWVNGQLVYKDKQFQQQYPGQFISGQ